MHGNGGGSSGGAYRRDNNAARWTRDRAELLAYLPELEGRVFAERDTIHSFEFRQELTHTALRVLQEGRRLNFSPCSTRDPSPVPNLFSLPSTAAVARRWPLRRRKVAI